MEKVLFFGSFAAGVIHGYCHALNIPLHPAIHRALTYGGPVVYGVFDGAVGATFGREYGLFQSLRNFAAGAASGAFAGAVSMLAGYGAGYVVGRFF